MNEIIMSFGNFSLIRGRIEECGGDAVINSIGIETPVKGRICNAIVTKADSQELIDTIHRVNDVYSIGDIFITSGYKLKVQHIVHVLPPFKKDDKKDNRLFKECIRRLLNECQLRQLFNISIPLIGTGANGYEKNEVIDILKMMCRSYCEVFDHMNISIVLYDENGARYARDKDFHSLNTLKKATKETHSFENSFSPYFSLKDIENYFDYDSCYKERKTIKVEPLKDFEKNTIEYYVNTYANKRNGRDIFYPDADHILERIKPYFGYKKSGNPKTAGGDSYSKIKLNHFADKRHFYKLMFALKMNLNEAMYFLEFFGYTFAKGNANKVDDAVKYLIERKQYGIIEIEDYFKKQGISEFSIFNK